MGTQLEYDHTPPRVGRRPMWIAIGVLLILLIGYSLKDPAEKIRLWWERERAIAAMLKLQDACLAYAFPPDTLVLDHSPATPQSLAQPGYSAVTEMGGKAHPNAAIRSPKELNDFRKAIEASFPTHTQLRRDSGVVFMHARKTPSGTPVLIVAYIFTDGAPDPRYEAWYQIRLVRMLPATSTSPPARVDEYADMVFNLRRPVNGVLQISAGVPDPNDPTHFVIPMTKGSNTINVHCWLRDDFRFKVRASGGIVQQDDSCLDTDIYWSLPEDIHPDRLKYYHRGLD